MVAWGIIQINHRKSETDRTSEGEQHTANDDVIIKLRSTASCQRSAMFREECCEINEIMWLTDAFVAIHRVDVVFVCERVVGCWVEFKYSSPPIIIPSEAGNAPFVLKSLFVWGSLIWEKFSLETWTLS